MHNKPNTITWAMVMLLFRIMETAPTLPDFALALKPDEYQLPPADPSWSENVQLSHIGINQFNHDKR